MPCFVPVERSSAEAMEPFSPELAQHWLDRETSSADGGSLERREESLTPSQEAALVALADRVSAARSVY
jgi:hypothetical protein